MSCLPRSLSSLSDRAEEKHSASVANEHVMWFVVYDVAVIHHASHALRDVLMCNCGG